MKETERYFLKEKFQGGKLSIAHTRILHHIEDFSLDERDTTRPLLVYSPKKHLNMMRSVLTSPVSEF